VEITENCQGWEKQGLGCQELSANLLVMQKYLPVVMGMVGAVVWEQFWVGEQEVWWKWVGEQLALVEEEVELL
jgi:hypothetical protein